uniref:Uncharacterized protein n=1 Tax=Romanomermis culicivorax TaxID=13658 RepID=A0A915HS38_ROMCU
MEKSRKKTKEKEIMNPRGINFLAKNLPFYRRTDIRNRIKETAMISPSTLEKNSKINSNITVGIGEKIAYN